MQDDNKTWLYVLGGVVVLVVVYFLFKGGRPTIDPATQIPDYNATSGEWILWHKSLLAYGYSKQDANMVWLNAFNQYAKDLAIANDYTLRNYAQTQGMNVADYSVLSGAYDLSVNTGKGVSGFFGSLGTGFALGTVVFVLLITGALFLALRKA